MVTSLPPGARADSAPPSAGVRMVLEGEACLEPDAGPALTLGRGDVIRTRDVRIGEWQAGAAGVRWVDVTGSGHDRCVRPCPSAKRVACRPLPRVHRWAMTEAVLAGAGASVVGGPRFGWEAGDVFAIPPGAAVDHRADETADLLIVSALESAG